MQQIGGTPYPAGTVIVPTSGTPRYMEFFEWLDRLRVPEGTKLFKTKSAEIAKSMNYVLDEAVGEWVLFMGDDHTFHPDTVMRLLNHNLDAVVPLNVMRYKPFPPVLFRGELGPSITSLTWDEVPVGNGLWYLPNDIYPGSAGLMLKKSVIDRIEKPVFRVGQFALDTLNEDFYLFSKLREMDIPVVVDLGCPMGHINNFTVRPQVIDGQWGVVFLQENRVALIAKGGQVNDRPGCEG